MKKNKMIWQTKLSIIWIVGNILFIILFLHTTTPSKLDKKAKNKSINSEWFHDQYLNFFNINARIAMIKTTINMFEKDSGKKELWSIIDKERYEELCIELTKLKEKRELIKNEYNKSSSLVNQSIIKYGLPIALQ